MQMKERHTKLCAKTWAFNVSVFIYRVKQLTVDICVTSLTYQKLSVCQPNKVVGELLTLALHRCLTLHFVS